MTELNQNPEQIETAAISSDEAFRLYQQGIRRFRRLKPAVAGNGLDTNSYDFRGVRAAMDVVRAFPHETDESGQREPVNLKALKVHMDLGLTAITEVGSRPLADEFVAGYQRMAKVFSRPPEEPAP